MSRAALMDGVVGTVATVKARTRIIPPAGGVDRGGRVRTCRGCRLHRGDLNAVQCCPARRYILLACLDLGSGDR
jgi:hypothetical protein